MLVIGRTLELARFKITPVGGRVAVACDNEVSPYIEGAAIADAKNGPELRIWSSWNMHRIVMR